MAEFRFEAIAPDGAEIRDTIKALDHESAEDALREKGLFVYGLKSVRSPEDLERRCAECNHVNNWNVMVCANCGAPIRGPHIGPNEHVELTELPQGLVVRENIDGSITVTKTGWRRWGWAYVWLVALGWVAVGWALVFFFARSDPAAHRFAGTVLGLLAFAALVACTLWALFARDEWHVGEGFFESRRSLFGMDWGHTFRAGIIRLEWRSLSWHCARFYRVYVLDREQSCILCEEHSDSPARVLAALLAQRTGWVLDDQIRDWSWLENAYPSTFLRWWKKLRGQR
ncbi:MAG: hypothetical protein ACREJB_11920 [Planctomycetaceae bacterium]